MRNVASISLLAFVLASTVPSMVDAQSWGFVAVTPNSTTVGGGRSFGSGRIRPGLWGDITHANDITQGRPDLEIGAGLTILFGRWFLSPNIGAGATITLSNGNVSWSGRALVILSQTTPVAFRLQWYSIVGFTAPNWMSKIAVGVSIQLGASGLRLFPNLGLAVSSPGTNGNIGVNIIPGAALLF